MEQSLRECRFRDTRYDPVEFLDHDFPKLAKLLDSNVVDEGAKLQSLALEYDETLADFFCGLTRQRSGA